MKLPQDRILHIDIEYIENKANITAEWQGELVRCKDCKWHLNGHLCKQLSQYGSIETPPSFYCGFGERREP